MLFPGADVAPRRRNRRGLLKLYYGVSDDDRTAHSHPTDIDGPHFKVRIHRWLNRRYNKYVRTDEMQSVTAIEKYKISKPETISD